MKKNRRLIGIGLLPLALGVSVRLLLSVFCINEISINRIEFVLNSIITFASALSGFILSSLSILIGLSNSPIMVYIRKKGTMPELQCRYTSALLYSIVLIAYCVFAGMIVGNGVKIEGASFSAAIILLVSFLYSTVITGKYLLSLIALAPEENPVKEKVYAPIEGFNFGSDYSTSKDTGTTQNL